MIDTYGVRAKKRGDVFGRHPPTGVWAPDIQTAQKPLGCCTGLGRGKVQIGGLTCDEHTRSKPDAVGAARWRDLVGVPPQTGLSARDGSRSSQVRRSGGQRDALPKLAKPGFRNLGLEARKTRVGGAEWLFVQWGSGRRYLEMTASLERPWLVTFAYRDTRYKNHQPSA